MKKVLVVLLVLALCIGMLAACTPKANSGASSGGPQKVKIGLAMNALDAMAFQAFAAYIEKALTEQAPARGYEVEFTMLNANADVTKQANDVKDLLAAGCDVILCPALDSVAILPSIQEVHKAGKYFVMYFREASPTAEGDQVPDATVNMESMYQAYDGMVALFDMMKKDGVDVVKIINVHGDITDENATNRNTGFMMAVEEYGYADKVAAVVDCGRWEPEVAMANTASALQQHPDANVLYTASDYLMFGVQTALENANKWFPRGEKGHVYICASDMFPIGIELTLQKYIDTNVDVGCWAIAARTAEVTFDLLDGKTVDKTPELVTGLMITSDNAAEMIASTPFWGVDFAD